MKLKIYVHAQWDAYEKKYKYSAYSFKWTPDKTLICEQEIEFDEPPFEVLQSGTVAAYRAEQERIRAETHVKLENIQAQIDELLCLEYKPEPQ